MVCVGEAYKHQLKQMWQIADVQSLYASRCGLASLLNTLIPSQKEKKQNNSSLFSPNVKVRPLQQNWKPTGCHRAQTFERHKVHVSRRGIYKKQKHIETQVRAIKRVNRDHIQSTCFTHFFYCFFVSLYQRLCQREKHSERHIRKS